MMKKQFLRRALLTLVGGVILSMSAWADGTKTIGAEDNTTGWWQVFSDPYTIAPNQTLKVQFVNYSSKANVYNNFAVILTKDQDINWSNTGGAEYLVMRADCYGWQYGNNTNDNSNNWFKVNFNDYNLDNNNATSVQEFKDNLDGATIALTIKRLGAEVYYIVDATTSDGNKKFRHFFVMDCGDGNDNIRAYLTVDNAHIVIDNTLTSISASEALTPVEGTLIGHQGNATPWWSAFSDYYTLQANQSAKFHFKNYSCKAQNGHNWVLFVTSDADRGSCTEYLALRADNWGWGTKWDSQSISSNYNWDTFRDELDGADVEMTIVRNDGIVTITANQTVATDGTTIRTEKYTFTDNSIKDDGLRVFLTTEGGHLDLLPATVEVTSTYGWVTFSSDYALDFTNVTDLEAYTITGYEGNAINKVKVTGTVPAGTGLLLKADAGTYSIPVATSATAAENCLVAGKGEEVGFVSGKTRYVLGLNSSAGKLEFQKLVDDGVKATVPADKAYLEFDEEISAPFLSFEGDGETTGIANVNVNANSNSSWYDLSGRRVANPTKGLYIVNGKKVIIK